MRPHTPALLLAALLLAPVAATAPAQAQEASVPFCLAAAEAANREPTVDVVGEPAALDRARAALEAQWRNFATRSGFATTGSDLGERQTFAGALYVRLGCSAVTGALL